MRSISKLIINVAEESSVMSKIRNVAVLAAVMVLGLPMVSAQSTQIDKNPGMVGAGSPLYGLEVAMDNAAVDIGMAKAGEVAKERASEASKAAENGKAKAAAKAGKNLARMANKTKGNESEDIETAMASFQDTMSKMEQRIQNAPNENARQGMQKALENMQGAYQNMQEAKERADSAGRPSDSTGRPDDSGQQNRPDSDDTNSTDDGNTTEDSSDEETTEEGNTTSGGNTSDANATQEQ